jgi:hypothetical protein
MEPPTGRTDQGEFVHLYLPFQLDAPGWQDDEQTQSSQVCASFHLECNRLLTTVQDTGQGDPEFTGMCFVPFGMCLVLASSRY